MQQGDSHAPHRIDSPHFVGDHPHFNFVPPPPVESTVVIVDADPVTRSQMCHLMAYAGLTIDTYCTAEEFLTSNRSRSSGCLVFDIDVTVTSGPELRQQLVQMGNRLPVIVLATAAEMMIDIETIQQIASTFIRKPGDPKAILDAVNQAIAQDSEARQQELSQAHAASPRVPRFRSRKSNATIDGIQLKMQ